MDRARRCDRRAGSDRPGRGACADRGAAWRRFGRAGEGAGGPWPNGPDAEPAVPDLIRLLDDPDLEVRKSAARALGRIGPAAQAAVPALMRSLVSPGDRGQETGDRGQETGDRREGGE